jgi:hypothetical protein
LTVDTLLSVIAVWLSINFGLPGTAPHPTIELHPEETMSRIWIESIARNQGADIGALARETQHREIQAFYDDQRRTILLAEGWDAKSPQDVSILVHEMVHHLQNLDQRRYACPAAREKLAYEAQDSWLGLFGSSLEIQFDIDAMTLLLSTKCMH